MISFVGELSSSNDKNDAVNFSSDWRGVRSFQFFFLGRGEGPVDEE